MSWMQTSTGRVFRFDSPEFYFDDIVIALSKINRYNGHTKGLTNYTVAEHCVTLARYGKTFTKEQRWNLLMHDAAEAYLCDLPRPWKERIPQFRVEEARIETALAARYGLTFPMPDYVKEMDNRILVDERDQLMNTPPLEWSQTKGLEPLGVKLMGWDAQTAYIQFKNAALEFSHVPLY